MFTLAGYKAWPDGKQAAVREQLSDGWTQRENYFSVWFTKKCVRISVTRVN